ncbi:MAG: (Fe-S)-binding protein [Proteobacteria bacterium]|nr:(Fe-S)-binding protein [Pseudomonadota bacterium]
MDKATDNTLLQEAKNKVGQCDRCGACLPVCPLFGVRDVELSSARGKNAIALALAEGGIEPALDTLAAVNFCLLCRACVENCPSKVKTDEAMIDLRQFLVERTGATNAKYRAAGGLLGNLPLVKLAAGTLALLRKLGLNSVFPHGLAPDEYTRAHFLAAFAGPAALGRKAPPSEVEITSKTKVAYFYGCGMRMMFPGAASETLAILQTTTRVLRPDNVCCGLPHLAHGLRGDFLALARKNIRLYEEADLIVSDCASCSGTLKHIASFFAGDPKWEDRAEAFSRKAMDLTEYLVKAGYTPRQKTEAVFTYHDPCHLARGQGIKTQPRDLLKAAGEFVEMEEADACCGGAGSFHVDYPEISAKILEKKRGNIEKTGAAVVVTGCPGCLIQLTKAAEAGGGRFRAMHISQVI